MPSTDGVRESIRLRSLSARVAVGTAAAAALIALVSAIVSLVAADRLIRDEEDRSLRSAASISLRELTTANPLGPAIEDELAEAEPVDIRLAIRRANGQHLGGDTQLPLLAPASCVSIDRPNQTLRACTVADERIHITAARARAARSMSVILLSCAMAVLVSAIAAAFLGRRTSRWALAPLARLGESLRTIDVDEPGAAHLAGDASFTEIAGLRSALESLLARLASALDTARAFSAEAAHELKTPLSTIVAELDLLAEEPLDTNAGAAVERLRTRVGLLGRLVERLLLLTNASKLAAAATAPVAVEDIVSDVIARQPRERARRVTTSPGVAGIVNGDELLLTALVENLIDNALKYAVEGSVRVNLEETELSVVLEVIDDGPGLSAEATARAFEPFFRTAASRATTPGHGLGLAIVAQIARAHDGAVELLPRPHGAHVRVTLPAWRAPPAGDQ